MSLTVFLFNGYGDMVIMSMEIYESTMRQIAMYRDIEISEKQTETGQIKDARKGYREAGFNFFVSRFDFQL